MTYVTLDIFTKMCRAGGIESHLEYRVLYNHGILPTNLVPINPSVYYKSKPKDKRKRVKILNMFEKKYGRKCNFKDNEDRRLYRKIYYQGTFHPFQITD